VLAAEHFLDLARLDLRGEARQPLLELVADRFPGLSPFDEDGEIVRAALERQAEVPILLEAAAPLEQLLRGGLVFPEVRLADLRLYGSELGFELGGVKDSSAGRRRAWRGPGSGVRVRPVEWSFRYQNIGYRMQNEKPRPTTCGCWS
jgi:hypothetical protein